MYFCFLSKTMSLKKNFNSKVLKTLKIKTIVVNRVENGESVYRLSKELGIPYLTIKNWVLVSQNEKIPVPSIKIPDTNEVIISEDEKKELISYMEESARNVSPEDSMFRHIEEQNEEISDLKQLVSDLRDEIDMLKKAAIALSKQIPDNKCRDNHTSCKCCE